MKKKHLRRLIILYMNMFQEDTKIEKISLDLNLMREIINEINVKVKDFSLEDDIEDTLKEYLNKYEYIKWYHTTENWDCLVEYLDDEEIPEQFKKYNKKNIDLKFSYLKDMDKLDEKIEAIQYLLKQIKFFVEL